MMMKSSREIERTHKARNYKLVPAAMQADMGAPPPSQSKAAKKNRERKAQRDGKMVHTSVVYGNVDVPGFGVKMVRTGGKGTYAPGNNVSKRESRKEHGRKGRKHQSGEAR